MKLYMVSSSTGKRFCPEDCARILNIKQILFYMKKGIEIKDFYPTTDYKTGEPVLAFLVDRKESSEAYCEWMKTNLKADGK